MARIVALWFLVVLFSQGQSAGNGQELLAISRDRVLAFDMDIAPYGPYSSSSVSNKIGLIWDKAVIDPANSSSIRIHFTVSGVQATKGWMVKITNLSGAEVEHFYPSSFATRREQWSAEIAGKGGRIQLWRTDQGEMPAVTVDKYAYSKKPSVPKAIYGTDDRQPISAAPHLIQQRGKAVARLRFMVPEGEALCTGFLVSNDLLVTNNHCIDRGTDLSSLIAEFGLDTSGSVADKFRATSLEWTDHDLDYSIVRLDGGPGVKYGRLAMTSIQGFPDKTKLVIVQHPGGEPKQVSIKDCAVSGTQKIGIQNETDFGHSCDTLGGSSGSPVMRLSDGALVGLHHFGFKSGDPNPVNQAVYIHLIIDDLSSHVPNLRAELLPSSGGH